MRFNGTHYRTIWFDAESGFVKAIDQTRLPHFFDVITLDSLAATCHAIRHMQVRGAPLIGAAAAFGIYLALRDNIDPVTAGRQLLATRPTAVNLSWAIARMQQALAYAEGQSGTVQLALDTAQAIADEDVAHCTAIGTHGLALIDALARRNNGPVNILTHCNAGWLATVDRGTALAPVYAAREAGIPLHVWVDETRPRNQGASLTAWELAGEGIAHTVISDNAGGHLMQAGKVDLCLVGSDRTTRNGDVCNKIGTYLKALAAHDNNVPFYVAVPVSSIDWTTDTFPIEERDGGEITHIQGLNTRGDLDRVRLTPAGSPALNHAFDITPARLVTGLVTELGLADASTEGLNALKQKLDHNGTP